MSIFDGHENKTTEELAAELGIPDLSVVDNAGREILEVFEETDIFSNEINLTVLNNENSWSSNVEISTLEIGMRIKKEQKLGTIDGINSAERLISIKRKDNLYSNYKFSEFKKEIDVFLMDRYKALIEKGEWKQVTSIVDDIKKGVRLRIDKSTHHDLIVKRLEIKGDQKDGEYILTCDNGAKITLFSKQIGRYKIFRVKDMNRIRTSNIEDIVIDRKCRNIYSGEIWIISNIDDITLPVKQIQIYREKDNLKEYIIFEQLLAQYQLLIPENSDDNNIVFGGQIETSPSGI